MLLEGLHPLAIARGSENRKAQLQPARASRSPSCGFVERNPHANYQPCHFADFPMDIFFRSRQCVAFCLSKDRKPQTNTTRDAKSREESAFVTGTTISNRNAEPNEGSDFQKNFGEAAGSRKPVPIQKIG